MEGPVPPAGLQCWFGLDFGAPEPFQLLPWCPEEAEVSPPAWEGSCSGDEEKAAHAAPLL